jgi:AbrB family looped-hinge helix DNA binding protein
MQRALITKAGQMSVPADIRRRWNTRAVLIEDRGEYIVIRPAPADAIAAFRGSFKARGPSSEEGRRLAREEERLREEEKAARHAQRHGRA